MNNLILPVGGLSVRFANVRPKWLLTHPNGNFMFIEAIKGLNLDFFDNIYLVCVKSTLEKYKCEAGIYEQVKLLGNVKNFKLVILDEQTRNQPETVYTAVIKENITGSICVKDCDNYFKITATGKNFISYANLDDFKSINASNKSYAVKNNEDVITNIAEKQILSKHFCTGSYGFEDVENFKSYFQLLKDEDNLYISHIIYKMILDGFKFSGINCLDYLDWGTLTDWISYTKQYATLFVDLDGTLVENSAEYFEPKWGETDGIKENVECINKLYDSGKVHIILITCRKEYAKDTTEKQLSRLGLRYHRILYDLMHAKRILINDYSTTNPYPSCASINLKRNSNELATFIGEHFKES